MNVESASPRGDAQRHIEAARDWLCRAEKQFQSDQAVIGAATLMLAQAEMKLAVEGVGTRISIPDSDFPKPSIRLHRAGKTAFTAIAFAAILAFGIFLGHMINRNPVDNSITQIADSGNSAESISSLPGQQDEFSGTEISLPGQGEEGIGITAVESMGTTESGIENSVPTGTRSSARPSRVSNRESAGVPVVMPGNETEIPESQPDESTGVSGASSPEEISPAEVTLRTIQALAERLAGKTE